MMRKILLLIELGLYRNIFILLTQFLLKMKKYLMLLLIILIVGCAKEIDSTSQVPGVVDSSVEIDDSLSSSELVEEVVIEETNLNVRLTKLKTLDPEFMSVKVGTKIRFLNEEDNFNHNLIILFGVDSPTEKDILARSGNIGPGDYWEFEFVEQGEYSIRDIYSSSMRGEITAEVIHEPSGNQIGRVKVRS